MITARTESIDGRAVLIVEHPDGGCTTIADLGDAHAVLTLNSEDRRFMRAKQANGARAEQRRIRREVRDA